MMPTAKQAVAEADCYSWHGCGYGQVQAFLF